MGSSNILKMPTRERRTADGFPRSWLHGSVIMENDQRRENQNKNKRNCSISIDGGKTASKLIDYSYHDS